MEACRKPGNRPWVKNPSMVSSNRRTITIRRNIQISLSFSISIPVSADYDSEARTIRLLAFGFCLGRGSAPRFSGLSSGLPWYRALEDGYDVLALGCARVEGSVYRVLVRVFGHSLDGLPRRAVFAQVGGDADVGVEPGDSRNRALRRCHLPEGAHALAQGHRDVGELAGVGRQVEQHHAAQHRRAGDA